MKINRQQLQKYKNQPLIFDQELILSDESLEAFTDRFLEISPVNLDGQINLEKNNDLIVRLKVTGEIVVPSSRSQEPVKLPINLDINEIYIEDQKDFDRYTNSESVFLLDPHHLDVDKIIADNIFTSLPLTVLSDNEKKLEDSLEGQGWKLYKEDEI